MRALRILKSNIKESFQGVFRNFSLSLASISCITITLILVGFSILLTVNVNNFTKGIEEDMTIVVFLDRKIDDENITRIKGEIEALGNIKEIEFNSKNDVKLSMQEDSEIFNSILSEYTDDNNPLQDTYLIKVEEIKEIGKTADKIGKIEGVDIVKYGEGAVEELIKIFDLVKRIMYIVVIALVVVTAFLISNTIKITISSRQREISIMRLIGASNLNIRIPFIIEGLVLGLFGSIIPVFATIYGYTELYKHFDGHLFSNFIKLIKPIPFVYRTSAILVLVGILVGMFGSWRAVRKHLKI